jgi:hypothetical protein
MAHPAGEADEWAFAALPEGPAALRTGELGGLSVERQLGRR